MSVQDDDVSDREMMRFRSLLELIPERGESVLDVGARDGRIASMIASRFRRTVALDLVRPNATNALVECVAGDATSLPYEDASFDTVICAEVLEHIKPPGLELACREIMRVARRAIVIGVPYRQDLRCGETMCATCGRVNPPWGHVNCFDERLLLSLFPDITPARVDRVGAHRDVTNGLSARLMHLAGHPYGTYEQKEHCVHCDAPLRPPRERVLAQRVASKLALTLQVASADFYGPRAPAGYTCGLTSLQRNLVPVDTTCGRGPHWHAVPGARKMNRVMRLLCTTPSYS